MLELNKIYNMDCLEGMKQLDDNSIDLVVTDPPYGINIANKGTVGVEVKAKLKNEGGQYIKVVVRVTTSEGSMSRTIELDAYHEGFDYNRTVYLEDEGLLTGDDVYVTVTAYRFGEDYIASMSLRSDGYQVMEFTIKPPNIIDYLRYNNQQ